MRWAGLSPASGWRADRLWPDSRRDVRRPKIPTRRWRLPAVPNPSHGCAQIARGAAVEHGRRIVIRGAQPVLQHISADATLVEPTRFDAAFLFHNDMRVASAGNHDDRGVRTGARRGIAIELRHVAIGFADSAGRAVRP